jgi:2-methylcitrate dehydratase
MWDHVASYAPERARREQTVRLWHKVETVEDPEWTARYHEEDPQRQAFGARVEIQLADGEVVEDQLAVANAHVHGQRPFGRDEYLGKLAELTDGLVEDGERERFVELVGRLRELDASELAGLTLTAADPPPARDDGRGIF